MDLNLHVIVRIQSDFMKPRPDIHCGDPIDNAFTNLQLWCKYKAEMQYKVDLANKGHINGRSVGCVRQQTLLEQIIQHKLVKEQIVTDKYSLRLKDTEHESNLGMKTSLGKQAHANIFQRNCNHPGHEK
ncbi:hypothetical protein EJB05_34586, partial [Eragrostis curvula]